MGEATSLCGEITGSRGAVCDICIVLCSILKMVPKCYITFTTCSQLICPERPIPHSPPLQLKKKHLAVTSSLLSPIIRTPSPLLVPSLPSSAYFRYAISFLSFSCVSLARPCCTLLKCIISNYSSKANCLPREPKPCPVLQEITLRMSTIR